MSNVICCEFNQSHECSIQDNVCDHVGVNDPFPQPTSKSEKELLLWKKRRAAMNRWERVKRTETARWHFFAVCSCGKQWLFNLISSIRLVTCPSWWWHPARRARTDVRRPTWERRPACDQSTLLRIKWGFRFDVLVILQNSLIEPNNQLLKKEPHSLNISSKTLVFKMKTRSFTDCRFRHTTTRHVEKWVVCINKHTPFTSNDFLLTCCGGLVQQISHEFLRMLNDW